MTDLERLALQVSARLTGDDLVLVLEYAAALTRETRLEAMGEALRVPEVWSENERDGMSSAFKAADGKHGHYETLFAVAAWLLRYRAKQALEDVIAHRAIIRGRTLTAKEQLENLRKSVVTYAGKETDEVYANHLANQLKMAPEPILRFGHTVRISALQDALALAEDTTPGETTVSALRAMIERERRGE